jgi:hypothetical protein
MIPAQRVAQRSNEHKRALFRLIFRCGFAFAPVFPDCLSDGMPRRVIATARAARNGVAGSLRRARYLMRRFARVFSHLLASGFHILFGFMCGFLYVGMRGGAQYRGHQRSKQELTEFFHDIIPSASSYKVDREESPHVPARHRYARIRSAAVIFDTIRPV